MNVDWLLVLNILRIAIAIIILLFASYYDIRTRQASNHFWVILGLTGISLLECQMIIEFGLDAFQYILPLIPLTILFMSLLTCDGVVDLETRKANDSWIFLIALAGFTFLYLFLFPTPASNKNTQSISIFLPMILFLLFFIFIQSLFDYLAYRVYKSYKDMVARKTKKKPLHASKSPESTKILQPKSAGDENNKTKVDGQKQNKAETERYDQSEANERTSWVLFFGSLSAVILIFLMTDIITITAVRYFGQALLVLIPIFIIFFYIRIESSKKLDAEDANLDEELDIDLDELPVKPPSRLLYQLMFCLLIIFGFFIIIYYSTIDELTNVMVQIFIIMVWILIFYGFYNLGLPRGGADTKALMALAIVIPIYPIIQYITIQTSFYSLLDEVLVTGYIFPFAFSVLINAAFVMLFYVIGLFIYNTARHDLKFPHSFLGYKIPISEVDHKFVWLMERMEDGRRKLVTIPASDIEQKGELDKLKAAKIRHVWVTPKIPFIIPMTLGLILAVVSGNLVFLIISPII